VVLPPPDGAEIKINKGEAGLRNSDSGWFMIIVKTLACPLCSSERISVFGNRPNGRVETAVAQTSKSAVPRISNPHAGLASWVCRLGSRRYGRFGNLRYKN
jgi:hypothetical protein